MKFNALSVLQDLLAIDSQTKNVEGVSRAQLQIGKQLESLGFSLSHFSHPEFKSADLLLGVKEYNPLYPWINFIAHADTVLPSFPLKLEGKIWSGSGVADNKGGVVTLLQTLHELPELPCNLRVVISPNEEAGSPGFHHLYREWGKTAFLNLGFEPALDKHELIQSRNGNRWYEIKLNSLSAHAGRAPKGRVNLIHRMAIFVNRLSMITNDFPGLNFNVTSVYTDNERFNVIPDALVMKLDVRFNSFNGVNYFHQALMEELKYMSRPCELTETEVKSEWSFDDDCPPMSVLNAELFEDFPFPLAHSGGAADINYFSTPTNICLDGLGGRGGQLHSKEEWLDTESVYERAKFLSKWIGKILLEDKTEIRNKPDSVLNYHSSRP